MCTKTDIVLSYWRFPAIIPRNVQIDPGISVSAAQAFCYTVGWVPASDIFRCIVDLLEPAF